MAPLRATRCGKSVFLHDFLFFLFSQNDFSGISTFCKKVEISQKMKKIIKVATLTWPQEIIGILVLIFMNFMNFDKFH